MQSGEHVNSCKFYNEKRVRNHNFLNKENLHSNKERESAHSLEGCVPCGATFLVEICASLRGASRAI